MDIEAGWRYTKRFISIKISKNHIEKLNAELEKILGKLESELKNSHKNSKSKTGIVTNALEDKLVSYGEKLSAIIMILDSFNLKAG